MTYGVRQKQLKGESDLPPQEKQYLWDWLASQKSGRVTELRDELKSGWSPELVEKGPHLTRRRQCYNLFFRLKDNQFMGEVI